MLIITSLGLQDSVTSLSVKYYTKSLDYDVIANLTGTVDKAESYERRADADAAECLMEKSVSLRTDAGTRTELPDRAGRRPDDDSPRQGRNLRPAGNRHGGHHLQADENAEPACRRHRSGLSARRRRRRLPSPSAKSSTTTSRRAFISTARHGNPSARANSSPPA